MTTISYPAKGTSGFTIEDWATFFDGEDGILNDYVGTALTLTRINTGEIARYSPGLVRVGGYVLEVTANHDLTVGTGAATYYTWACYDPLANVADGGGAASVAGPCTLGISTGLPSTTDGKQYVIMHKIVRAASQALTAATVTAGRRWTSTVVEWPSSYSLESVETDYPRGTLRYDSVTGGLYVRTANDAGNALEWREVGGTSWIALPYAPGFSAETTPAQYRLVPGGTVQFRGTVKRTAGGSLTSGDTTLGTMPVALRPNYVARQPIYGKPAAGNATVLAKVDTAGLVAVYSTTTMPDPVTIQWVDLASLTYSVRA